MNLTRFAFQGDYDHDDPNPTLIQHLSGDTAVVGPPELTQPPIHFFFKPIIKDFNFFWFSNFLSKMALGPPTHFHLFWMFGFFLSLQYP